MEAALALALPLVVKPADNMGARGCRLARSDDELRLAIDAALPFSRSGRAIVEEYIEGPEYSIDALVYDGAIQLRGLADRHISFTPFFVELGHTIPSSAPAGLLEELVATFEAGVRALGLSHGAAKGDMKWCPARGSPVIGEIAARLSGGYMSGWTYPYSSGLQLTRDALLLAAGLRPPPTPADRGWVSAERAFISIPGTVGHIAGIRSALAAPHVKDLFLRIKPGDAVSFPSNNVEKCGNIISQAPDREGAIMAAEAAVRGILVRLEAPDVRTEAFLRGDGSIAGPDGSLWPPPAFILPPELARSIDQLPDRLTGVAADEGELPVMEAPGWENATARDWSGKTLAESARLAVESAGARLCRSGDGPAIAGLFWRALVRGGVQAGLYVLDREKKGMRSR
jgi:biotin carboxylase